MEHPLDIKTRNVDLLVRYLLRAAGYAGIRRMEVRALAAQSLSVVVTPALHGAGQDGSFELTFNARNLDNAVCNVFVDLHCTYQPWGRFLDSFKLWDRLGHDFQDDHYMLREIVDGCDRTGATQMWAQCITFLMNRGCVVRRLGVANSLHDRLADLGLIPVLLRPRWLKTKRLPGELARMVKGTLTGFGV